MNVLSDVQYRKPQKASENVVDEWIQEAAASSADGKALLKPARSLLARYMK